MNEHILFRKVYLKYIVLQVRAKISFMAMQARQTIVELFVHSILSSYEKFKVEGRIEALPDEVTDV